ncbi:hypothetical protein F5Y15DRAFT_391766 [Xylariaceae sp. FL0016]|nr:hypothetical protein F5Y15DRAFT_391766 [Xylariaceae sp. FL0016]
MQILTLGMVLLKTAKGVTPRAELDRGIGRLQGMRLQRRVAVLLPCLCFASCSKGRVKAANNTNPAIRASICHKHSKQSKIMHWPCTELFTYISYIGMPLCEVDFALLAVFEV